MHNEFAAEIAALKARIAALEAQLRWQPVEDGETVGLHTGDTTLTVDRAYLWTQDDEQSIVLPDWLRLCRFTRGE